jgi:hypothetical protein
MNGGGSKIVVLLALSATLQKSVMIGTSCYVMQLAQSHVYAWSRALLYTRLDMYVDSMSRSAQTSASVRRLFQELPVAEPTQSCTIISSQTLDHIGECR